MITKILDDDMDGMGISTGIYMWKYKWEYT